MARYINADKLGNEIKDLPEQERIELMGIYDVIRNQPPADVQEVKHGKWIRQDGRPEAICSECGRNVVYQVINYRWQFENYCPHCGAKMDGKD